MFLTCNEKLEKFTSSSLKVFHVLLRNQFLWQVLRCFDVATFLSFYTRFKSGDGKVRLFAFIKLYNCFTVNSTFLSAFKSKRILVDYLHLLNFIIVSPLTLLFYQHSRVKEYSLTSPTHQMSIRSLSQSTRFSF